MPGVLSPAPSTDATTLAGTAFSGPVNGIYMDNELVRVTGLDTFLNVEFWDGTAWREKGIYVWHGSVGAIGFSKASILENRPEVCIVQFESSITSGGRITVDCTLRRGMRVALFQVNTNTSTLLGASPVVAETYTKTNERELATAADANGHRLMLGAPRTWSHTAGTGLMAISPTRTFTFYVGLQLSGAGSGDLAADLSAQAIGVLNENVRVQRR